MPRFPRYGTLIAYLGGIVALVLLTVLGPAIRPPTAPAQIPTAAVPPTAAAAVPPTAGAVLPTAVPAISGRQESAPLPLSVSFVSGQRAVHLPARIIRRPDHRLGTLPEFTGLPPDVVLLVVLDAPSTTPLHPPADVGDVIAVYVGADYLVDWVGSNAAGQPVGPAALPPYRMAVLGRRAAPYLSGIYPDDRLIVQDAPPGSDPRVAPPTVAIPPTGPLPAYPAPAGPLPTPRPTRPGAYPAP
jgi:hypothetical protein